jgi:hypothetical protein
VQVSLAMVAKQWKQHNLPPRLRDHQNAPLKRAAQRSSHYHVGRESDSAADPAVGNKAPSYRVSSVLRASKAPHHTNR